MGDLNENLEIKHKWMASICNEHKLYDVLQDKHQNDCNYPIYIRGSTRLDYIFLSQNAPKPNVIGHNP